MKLKFILCVAFTLFCLSGCEKNDGSSVPAEKKESAAVTKVASTETEIPTQTKVSTEKDTSTAENKQQTIAASTGTKPGNDEYLTCDDIYLYSFNCGYLSEREKPKSNTVYLIKNQEQLKYAQSQWFQSNKENIYAENDNNTDFPATAFTQMIEKYPIESNCYLFEYDEVSCSGYLLHADSLKVSENIITFSMDASSYTPGEDEAVCDVMGGFFHIAAVPKQYFENKSFKNTVNPGESE